MWFETKSRNKIKFETKLTFTPVEYKIMHSFVFISNFRIVFQSYQIEFIPAIFWYRSEICIIIFLRFLWIHTQVVRWNLGWYSKEYI